MTNFFDAKEELPQSKDAEKGLICALLQAPGQTIARCAQYLSADAFADPAYKLLFDAICKWPQPEIPVDQIWLMETLKADDQLAEIGGQEALYDLWTSAGESTNAIYYAKIVLQKYALRQLMSVYQRAVRQCTERDADPQIILQDTDKQLSTIAQNGAAPKVYIEIMRPSQIEQYRPPPDLVLIGDYHIVRGTVFVIGGPPGVGKSRATIAMALSGATGLEWFGYVVHLNFRTLILQNENGLFRLKRELADIREPRLENYLRISAPPPYGMCFWKSEFRDQCRRYYESWGPQLVLIDPWNSVARDDRMRDYLETFDVIRDVFVPGDSGPALGVIAHIRKPSAGERCNGRALLNILAGSYVLGSIPRMAFVFQHASDDVDEERVVLTCCKNNDGALGGRSAWMRRNGLFEPVSDFDWNAWEIGEKEGLFSYTEVPKILERHSKGLSQSKLAKMIAERGVSRATAYRRIEDAEKCGLIKFQKGKDVYLAVEEISQTSHENPGEGIEIDL